MKKIISVTLLITILLSSFIGLASTSVTMYAPDGRTVNIWDYEVEAWKNVGWYDYPVTTVYAPDGRTAVIYTGDVQAWKNVGWYDYPVTTVYAPDGRTAVIYTGDVQAWKSVGWYTEPPKTYQNEYAYVLNQKIKSYGNDGRFSLVYINNDDIPELVIHMHSSHAAGAELYTFYNGRAIYLGTFGSFGEIYYQYKCNRFLSNYFGMGVEYVEIFQISNNTVVPIIEFNAGQDIYGMEDYYYVNSVPVSYSAYINKRRAYGIGDYYDIQGYTCVSYSGAYKLTSSTIRSVFKLN